MAAYPSRILTILLFSLLLAFAESLTISFCSTQNTGEQNGANAWPYQSHGWCSDTCKSRYAYGIIQGKNCFCSDYAPNEKVDISRCNSDCPGFPSDKCGNQAQALFGYYLLDNIKPSGTLGGTSPTPPPLTLTRPITTTATVLATVTTSLIETTYPPTSSFTITDTTSIDQSKTDPSITDQPTSTWKPTPSFIVTTVQGSIQTVTVTPTIPPSADQTSTPSTQPQNSFWSDTAKVAGTFTSLALIIVFLSGGLFFFYWRRRRSSDSVAIRSVSDHDGHSTHGAFFGALTEKRHSKLGLSTSGAAAGRGGGNERTPTSASPMSMSRRASQPLVHDQRLNPNALYAMGQDNGSHVSVGSFQDDRDYSRPVLHVRNPDSA